MGCLSDYIAGRRDRLPRREIGRLIDTHEWFTLARRARALSTGDPDPSLTLPLAFWPTVSVSAPIITRQLPKKEEVKTTQAPEPDAIDRFIKHGGYRIVPSDEAGTPAANSAALNEASENFDIDPEMVTPELAEIYTAQGLTAEAEKIYNILKARNS
ncbi:MAG: hypothetical protein LBV38_04780 [Alistipes sp.]|jgi:hypothetical protein|nr:hypothetical protein [Alistipes sp.]